MVSFVYNIAKAGFASALNWETSANMWVTLISNGADLSQTDTSNPDVTLGSVMSGNVLDGGTYEASFNPSNTSTFKSLANTAITANNTDDQGELDADDVTWTSINAGTAAAAVILKGSGAVAVLSLGVCDLIAYIDTGGFPITTNGGDLTISWANSGIITLTS